MTQDRSDERSLGDLFAELASETSTLVRQEIRLATAEMSQKAARAGRNVGLIGAGGALAYAGLLALVAAAIFGLAYFIPMWLSALIVGLVIVGIGYALIQMGLSALKRLDPMPRQTVETLKEDKEWAKEQLR
jgi:xanthine/uracil permease